MAIASVLASQTVAVTPGLTSEPKTKEDHHWREAIYCAPNSLYVLLKSWGWNGSLETLRNSFPPIGNQGYSLEDIRQASLAVGFQVEVVQTDLNYLSQSGSLPAIVHVDNRGSQYGHFVILVDVSQDKQTGKRSVTLFEPTSANHYGMPIGDFLRDWTTYAIVRKTNAQRWLWKVAALVFGLLGMALLTRVVIQRVLGRSSAKSPQSRGLVDVDFGMSDS